MVRRGFTRRVAVDVRQERIFRHRATAGVLTRIVAALLLSICLTMPGLSATLARGSTSAEDRQQALRDIPFQVLTPAARQKVNAVVEKPSLFRRMPLSQIDCDPQLYRFLVRHPEVVVNIWQLMGITKVSTDRVGPFTLNAKDGVGTVTQIELIYGDQDTHLMYCEGRYDGPLFRRPLTGRCVLLLKSSYAQTDDQRWQVGSRMDVFLQIDNIAVDAVTRTLHPLLGKSADLNFVQSTEFLERISKTSEENGTGMERLARRLDNVQPNIREQFSQLTQQVSQQAADRATTQVAQRGTDVGSK